MYHAVWKLSALAIIVAIGTVVVVQARRGMLDDAPPESEVAEGGDAGEQPDDQNAPQENLLPPSQGEPDIEMADDPDVKPVPALAKPRITGNRVAATSAAGDRPPFDDSDLDDDAIPPSRKTPVKNADPFGDEEPADDSLPPKSVAASKPASAAAPKKPAIDIVDLDSDDDPAVDADAGVQPVVAKKKEMPVRSRQPVLTLDEPDDSGETAENAGDAKSSNSGPRLLGATDEPPAKAVPVTNPNADPFTDDEPPTVKKKGRSAPLGADDEDDLDRDIDHPPAPLPRSAVSKAKPVAEDPFADETKIDDAPKLRADIETDARPARLNKTIEPEEADDLNLPSEKPEKISRAAPRLDEGPALQKQLPQFPDAPASEPPPPQTDDVDPEELLPSRKAPAPQITIEKIAPPTAALGQPMVYQILVRNVGDVPAHQVVVEDVIPDNVKIDGSIPQAQLKGKRLIWKVGTLAGGREKKISVRVIPQSEGTVGSVATVNFSPSAGPDPNVAQLKFDVAAPQQAAVGMPVEFSFRVKNVGSVPATRVTIRDVLPAGLKHSDGDDLEYEIGQIPAGKSKEVKLTLIAAQSGQTVNRVVVTADGNVSEEAEVKLNVIGPTLTVVRNGPKKLFPDKTGRYTNTITNPGASEISGATVVEAVPAGLEFVEAGDGGKYNTAKRTVTWTIKRIAAGESRALTVSLRAAARGTLVSVVRAYDGAGASGEAIRTTQVAGVPALSIEFGDIPAVVEPGDTVVVPLRIRNRGSDVAANVNARVTVPAGMKFVAAKAAVDHRLVKADAAGDQATAGADEVQFKPIGRIEPQEGAIFELTFKARVPGTARVQVQAQCDHSEEPVRREEVVTIAAPE